MDLGDYRVEQLTEGIFEVSESGSIQKIHNHLEEDTPHNPINRAGIDPVLIDTGRTCILLDAGLGIGLDHNDSDRNTSNILTNLDIFGYRASDIRHVILSHLHYDHTAGLSLTSLSGKIQSTLPNAKIYVQKMEWDAALHSLNTPPRTRGAAYEPDDLYRLVAEGQFIFQEKESQQILPGIQIIRTGGHTPGHQVVRIRSGKQTAYYCGDLIPNEHHLNRYAMMKKDADPMKARKAKTILIQQACREKALLLFYHSVYQKYGRIVRDQNRKFVLKTR